MNNALLIEEEPQIDSSQEIARLTKLLDALDALLRREEWRKLEELHFIKEKERIERLLLVEAKAIPIDEKRIYGLQGELKWANRYASMGEWAKLLSKQLKQYE